MLDQMRILIVEDEPMTGMDLAHHIESLNGTVVGPFGSVAEAMETLVDTVVDGAVLDGQLTDRDVTPVARRLFESNTPFVMFTGNQLPAEMLGDDHDVPVMSKPASPSMVLQRLISEMSIRRTSDLEKYEQVKVMLDASIALMDKIGDGLIGAHLALPLELIEDRLNTVTHAD